MPSGFQFLGDQRVAQGFFPVYDATHNNEVWFDEGLYPHTRNEVQNTTANAWTSWRSLTGPYVKNNAYGSGMNSNGSKGFYLQMGQRWQTPPNNSRDAEIEIAADNDVDTILYHAHMPYTEAANHFRYYPLELPPGLLKVRYRTVVSTHVSCKMFFSNGSTDMLSGYSSFENIGYVYESGGGVVIDGSNTIYEWGPWTFVGTSTKPTSLFRPTRRSNGSDGNTGALYYQVGVGDATNPQTIFETIEVTNGTESSSRSSQLIPCNLPSHTNFYIRVMCPNPANNWETDGFWHIESFC